ncbi:MAG TPA: GNAT family N-acetyltransferase [Rubrobacter sp.]|jgi:RimJ/RimL family protein N-acetyltransferase|nr:GNAT family N-acetyltransferase [Rubrobacter sp.]
MNPNDTNNVRLVELGDAPYHEYRRDLVRDYAADKVRAGAWSQAESEGRATRDVDGLLPEGPATQGHFLYAVRDDSTDAEVGTVWFALRDSGVGRSVWIYDLIIRENLRCKGYASRPLELVEDRAKELGAKSVELNVFGHNHGARALYEKMGYNETSITMAKQVGAGDG